MRRVLEQADICWLWCPLGLDVERRKSPVCGFVTPLEGSEADSHRKPEVSVQAEVLRSHIIVPSPVKSKHNSADDTECVCVSISAWFWQAIVLEGSYWKRRIEVVIKEYHKWRIYYKKRVSTFSIYCFTSLFPENPDSIWGALLLLQSNNELLFVLQGDRSWHYWMDWCILTYATTQAFSIIWKCLCFPKKTHLY